MTMMTRRTALGLVPALPALLHAAARSQAAGLRRLFSSGAVTYVIDPDGRVRCWTIMQAAKAMDLGFGDDRPIAPYVAQEVTALKGAIAIAVVGNGYAVMADGRVLAWGSNWNGLLGNTPLSELIVTAQQHPPGPMPAPTVPLPRVVDVSASERHVLALTAEGTVFAWGNGQQGQLGVGAMPVVPFVNRTHEPMAYVPYPIRVPELTGVSAIAAGSAHSLALMRDGSIRAWGDNRFGQLGDGSQVDRTSPVAVQGVGTAISVATGPNHSAALLADGRVMLWGTGSGALGRKVMNVGGANPVPEAVPGVSGVTAISLGFGHVLALTGAGTIVSWGDGKGMPTGHPGSAPAVVPVITAARSVVAVAQSSFAVLADGSIMHWGMMTEQFFRVDGNDSAAAHWPIPLRIKGL